MKKEIKNKNSISIYSRIKLCKSSDMPTRVYIPLEYYNRNEKVKTLSLIMYSHAF